MKSILTALKDGRLIELPETDKEKALRYLASIMEAIPEVAGDVAEGVLERERSANTGIGRGWACPHIRVDKEGELFSVLGWSPAGIDYGSSDGAKVHLLVMYYIPGNQRIVYLKELSALAKAIQAGKGIENIEKASNLNDVRNELLNWVSSSIDVNLPKAKARMIKLEARQAMAADVPSGVNCNLDRLIPFYLIAGAGYRHIILSQNDELIRVLESADVPSLEDRYDFEAAGYKVFVRSSTKYRSGRVLYDCIAVKS